MFPEYTGEEFENFRAVAEKLRSDYVFAHTLDAKLLPRGDSAVKGPAVRLFKPFDELFMDFEVYLSSKFLFSDHILLLHNMF